MVENPHHVIPPIVYRGAKEIGAAVGVPWKDVASLVSRKGLPAFKIDGYRHWLVMHVDLVEWIAHQRDEFRKTG